MLFDIRKKRKEANLTQDELAQRIGINRATLSKYETGQIDPPISQINKIAEALGITQIELITGNPIQSTPESNFVDEDELDLFVEKHKRLIPMLKEIGIDIHNFERLGLSACWEDYIVDIKLSDLERIDTFITNSLASITNSLWGIPDFTEINKYMQNEKPSDGLKKPNDGIE